MFTTLQMIVRVAIAIGLGSVIGLERTLAGKTAGMRTYAMVSLGASIFVLVSVLFVSGFSNPAEANPLILASAIISGIGFIGAGLVIFKDDKITGLTTAAGLWVSAGVGMASGFGFFNIALAGTIGALIIFTIFWFIEKDLHKFSYHKYGNIDSKQK